MSLVLLRMMLYEDLEKETIWTIWAFPKIAPPPRPEYTPKYERNRQAKVLLFPELVGTV